MPGPAVFLVPAGILAIKRLALQASLYCTPEAATAAGMAAIATILAKRLWNSLPEWIKEDISFRTLFLFNYDQDGERREELSHLASVIQSIHRYSKSLEAGVDVPQLHAAVMAYIRWSKQMKQFQMQSEIVERDLQYERAGRSLSLDTVRTLGHQEALEFSTWAYHRKISKLKRILEERDYELLQFVQSKLPGHVSFYVAVSGIEKKVMIGIRGTSTLEDLVTDCCGNAVAFQHDVDQEEKCCIEVEAEKPTEILQKQRVINMAQVEQFCVDDTHQQHHHHHYYHEEVEIISGHERIHVEEEDSGHCIRCHEGILLSAQRMCKQILPIIHQWALDAEFSVTLCGHSLGGGAATLVGLLLRSQFPEVKERLRVFAFGPPPVLDHDSAIAAASFVTSIVHNADLIPRCSLFNLVILLNGLRLVHERLVQHGINPTGPKSTTAFVHYLFSSDDVMHSPSITISTESEDGCSSNEMEEEDILPESLLESLEEEDTSPNSPLPTPDPLFTLEEWKFATERGTPNVLRAEHLFVPGRVILLCSPWRSDTTTTCSSNGNSGTSSDHDRQEQGSPPDEFSPCRTLRCVETDGTSPALRTLEADGPCLFTDHVTSSYFEALGMHYHFDQQKTKD